VSEYYCPRCASQSIESVEEAQEDVWMYHLHYCQSCGCSFRILRKSNAKPLLKIGYEKKGGKR
jgi:hypothetical protein